MLLWDRSFTIVKENYQISRPKTREKERRKVASESSRCPPLRQVGGAIGNSCGIDLTRVQQESIGVFVPCDRVIRCCRQRSGRIVLKRVACKIILRPAEFGARAKHDIVVPWIWNRASDVRHGWRPMRCELNASQSSGDQHALEKVKKGCPSEDEPGAYHLSANG